LQKSGNENQKTMKCLLLTNFYFLCLSVLCRVRSFRYKIFFNHANFSIEIQINIVILQIVIAQKNMTIQNEIILYNPNDAVQLEVRMENDTVRQDL
jgi:hypothetical protein